MGTKAKIVVGVVVVVVVGVVAFALLGGDDDETKSAKTSSGKSSGDKDKDKGSGSGSGSDNALHTLVVKRSSGKNATVAANALVHDPDQIWIRVSAAPKQETRVTWTLACGGGTANQDNYVVTPPHLRQLKVPSKTTACSASVAAQLAKPGSTGRVKAAVLANR